MWHPWNFFCVVNGDFPMILIISKIQTICLIMKNIDSVSEKQTNNNKAPKATWSASLGSGLCFF